MKTHSRHVIAGVLGLLVALASAVLAGGQAPAPAAVTAFEGARLIVGDGRPAIRFPPPDTLGECHRSRYRVFRMGGDVLFDLEMESRHPEGSDNQVSQII